MAELGFKTRFSNSKANDLFIAFIFTQSGGSQLGVILPPREHLVILETVLLGTNVCVCWGVLASKLCGRDAY